MRKIQRKLKPNIRLLRRVQRFILQHPDQFNMDSWFSNLDSAGHVAGGCGTAGCMAGITTYLISKHKTIHQTWSALGGWATRDRAAKALRIPIYDSEDGNIHPLFFADQWPQPFRRRYENAITARGKAQVTARRIEHFIKTGK